MIFKETGPIEPPAIDKEKLNNQRWEMMHEVSIDSPAVESFLDPAQAAKIWPEKIATNEAFLEQIEARKRLGENLNKVLKHLPRPDMAIETAIDQGHITEEQAVKMYESLNNLFESEPDYKRLALYLPFELLPNKKWEARNDELRTVREKFTEDYMKAWRDLLSAHDVRANFVDGDVLEVSQRTRDLPRVVKAAHLIPKIVEKGMLETSEVITLMEETDDQTLKNSIADAISVMADLGQLSENELAIMKNSKDQLIANTARIIESQKKQIDKSKETETEEIDFNQIQEEIREKFYQIENNDYGSTTKNRKAWLIHINKQEAIENISNRIANSILNNKISEQLPDNLLKPEADPTCHQALIEGIRRSIEKLAQTNIEQAKDVYSRYETTLLELWNNNDPNTKEALVKTFRHFSSTGIIDTKKLTELDIDFPKLAGPFSENLKLIEKELGDIQKLTLAIEKNPELSKMIYPAVLVYGSRIKGYGKKIADIDIAVFIRPSVEIREKEKLDGMIEQAFSHESVRDRVVEFWLVETDDHLEANDISPTDQTIGKKGWSHILFGAAWIGNIKSIKELHEKLLAPYLLDKKEIVDNRDARSTYIEELERDSLQYRLMHNGYERFYPPCGGIHTANSEQIDGDSMFWDSGYRQTATKLYIERVFLPKVMEK